VHSVAAVDGPVNTPGKATIAATLGGIAVVVVVSLVFVGGQTSAILSNVGAPIGGGDTTGDTTGNPATDNPTAGQIADGKATVPEQATQPELLIIRTGQLTIEVRSLDEAVAAARDRVTAAGGSVSGSDQSTDADQAAAAVTYRVPAARWDDVLAAVRGLGTATRNLHVETAAVTNQVVDLAARITNLRATEAALQAIMVKATRIPDVLDVQSKLSDVRGEIERLVAEKAHLEEQAAFGTLTVTFVLPAVPVVEEVKAGWDPAADADAASGALIGLGQRLVSLGIWVAIVGIPVAMGLGLLLAFAFVARRVAGRAQPGSGEA
jgi:hypothetical protein